MPSVPPRQPGGAGGAVRCSRAPLCAGRRRRARERTPSQLAYWLTCARNSSHPARRDTRWGKPSVSAARARSISLDTPMSVCSFVPRSMSASSDMAATGIEMSVSWLRTLRTRSTTDASVARARAGPNAESAPRQRRVGAKGRGSLTLGHAVLFAGGTHARQRGQRIAGKPEISAAPTPPFRHARPPRGAAHGTELFAHTVGCAARRSGRGGPCDGLRGGGRRWDRPPAHPGHWARLVALPGESGTYLSPKFPLLPPAGLGTSHGGAPARQPAQRRYVAVVRQCDHPESFNGLCVDCGEALADGDAKTRVTAGSTTRLQLSAAAAGA